MSSVCAHVRVGLFLTMLLWREYERACKSSNRPIVISFEEIPAYGDVYLVCKHTAYVNVILCIRLYIGDPRDDINVFSWLTRRCSIRI